MAKVALIEKYPTTYDFASIFPFEFDRNALVGEKRDKILKRDVTLNIEDYIKDFEYVILVGKEPCKLVADIRSVTEMQGYLVEDKFIGMLNPIAVKLNPSQKGAFDKSVDDILRIVSGKGQKLADFNSVGVTKEYDAHHYLRGIKQGALEGSLTSIAIDTETSSFYARSGYVLGISISIYEDEGVYIESEAMSDRNVELLQDIINMLEVIFFNMKFDKKMLEYHFNLKFKVCHDAMLEHYVLDEQPPHALKPLCIKYTDLGDYDSKLEEWKTTYCKTHGVLKKDFTYDLIPFDILAEYAGYDAGGTLILHNKFWPNIQKNTRLLRVYKELLLEGSDFLQEVEENGIPIGMETLYLERDKINHELAELTKEMYTYPEVKMVEEIKGALFNPNSTHHVGCLFFEVIKLPVIKLTATGNPSCDSEVLDELAEQHKIARTINEIKKLKKIKSTYLDKMAAGVDADGRFRTNFNLHTTTSGRLSSSGKMNAQQLPRKNKAPKNCMEAREGFSIVSQDLKTAEMYVAAVLSGDKVLQDIFVKKQDYHGSMAVQKFNLPCSPNDVASQYPEKRQEAKTISFEILYKLNYREPALKNFKRLKNWLQEQEAYIKQNGFIYSFFGRKRRLADVFSPNKKEAQHHVRSGINFLVQSVSSDINLLAGIEMQKWIKENGYQKVMIIWGLVHDSILAEVDDDYIDIYLHKLAEFTQKDRGLSIHNCPIGLDVEIGKSYGTVKPIDIQFPIYAITKTYKKIWEDMNVTYIQTESGTYVLDNKNVRGDTLGKRRLSIKNDIYKLYRPRKVFYTIAHLLKGNEKYFIDTNGVVFEYKKTEMVPLKYHRIASIIEAKDGECILIVHNLNYSYKTNCRRAYAIRYIGLLHTKYGFIPYDFCEEPKSDTRRKNMKKAVLSNRIYMNRTPELHEKFIQELTYILPPKRPGLPNIEVCDVTRVNKDILTLPIGRLDLIPESHEIVDKRIVAPDTFPKFKFKLREDQSAVYDAIHDNGIIQANPGWGKTFLGVCIALKFKQKTLIVVHTKHLLHQWIEEINKTLGINPGIVGDKKFNIDAPIVVGLVQSLRNRITLLNKEFGTVIVDECHHVPATVFKGIVDAFYARYKIGVTATPWRKDGQHIILYNYFGGPRELIVAKDNNAIKPTVIMYDSNIKLSTNPMIPWANRVNELYDNPSFMELFVNLCQAQAARGHLVLGLADRVEFLQQCHDILDESMLVVGGVEDRDFMASNKRILLGTSKIYAEGVNIPPLSSLVIGFPLNNRGLLEQLLGRVSRPHNGKMHPEVIDIMLAGKTGKNQAAQRINYYSEKNLKIKYL